MTPKDQARALAEKCAKRLAGWLLSEADYNTFLADPNDSDYIGAVGLVLSELQLETLIEDRERLDWFDKHFHIMRYCVLEGDDQCDGTYDYDAMFFAGNYNSEPAGDARLAIDNARKKEGE